jgi:hypothetical protein
MASSRVRIRRSPWFKLAALSALSRAGTLEEAARDVSAIGRPVSVQPVRDFLNHDFPIFADRTIAIKEPRVLDLEIEILLFHRQASNVPWLVQRLQEEPAIGRVDETDGYFNIVAEAVSISRGSLDDLTQRYETDERLVLRRRYDSLNDALMYAARAAVETL